MSGPPKFDPADFPSDGSSSTTTTAPSQTREQALAHVAKEVAKAKKKGNPNLAANLGLVADELTPKEGGYDPLSVLSIVPAAAAALLTPDDYLVGDVGTGNYQKLGDMSLAQQLFGDHQLSLADPIKGALTTPEEQQAYLNGTATTAQKVEFGLFEGAGLVGDVILDPINLIGGIGMTDDALKGLAEGTANLEKFAARASEAAATAAPDAPVSRLVRAIEEHGAAISDIEAQAASGALDPALVPSLKMDAGKALMDQWHLLNGESLVKGDTTLSKLRYARDGLVHEAPFGARSRAAATTERLTDHAQSIAAYLGDGENFSSVAESDLFRNIPLYGGKSAAELSKDAWQKGYAALPADLRESIGITGRIHRFNLEDLKSGRVLNPFAGAGSSTMPLRNPIPSPFSWIRGKAIEGEGMIAMLRPSLGRTGKLWRAALEVTNGTEASIQGGVNRIRKEVGVGVLSDGESQAAKKLAEKGPVAAQLAKMTDEELAAHPFTLMTEARLDSLIRNSGKTLKTAAQKSEQEISGQLVKAEADPALADKYLLAGVAGDVRPTPVWGRLKQRALDAADNAITGGGGQIKTRLAAAVDAAMRKADLPVDIERLALGSPPSVISMKVFDHIIQDPEFGQEISKIAREFSRHLEAKGLDEADLLRASMNAVSTAVAISKETGGIFHWVGAFADGKLAKELFSPQGAEALGRDAKLLHYSEQMGLAVADATYSEGSSADVRAVINDFVDQNLGVIGDSSVSLERLLQTRSELTKGLRLQGLTEEKIVKIEDELANNVIDRQALSDSLYDASLQAAEIAGEKLDTDALLKIHRKALRDAERTAQKLEETHLAILGYRSMDEDLARMVEDAHRAQQAVELVSVNMDPAISRLKQLSADEPPSDIYLPAERAFRGGRTKASTLLNIGLGDAPVADAAGAALQRFNSFLGVARDLFGDGVNLEKLAEHSPYTKGLTRGFDMTEGALNQAEIAGFFQETAHADVTAVADSFGGWYQVLSQNNEEAIAEIRRVGRNVRSRKANMDLGLTSVGVSEKQFTEFIVKTFADRFSAITPMIDGLVDAMDTGDFAALEQLAVGRDGGMEILGQLQNGDFTYIQTLADSLFNSLDTGIGLVGGFGDQDKFNLMRQIIRDDPATKASFDRMIEVMETFQNSSFYMDTLTQTMDTHQVIMDEIGNLVKPMRRAQRIADGKEALVDSLLAADLQGATSALEVTVEQRAALAQTLAGAKDRARALRSDLARMGRTSERLRAAHAERLKDLDHLELWIGRYEDLLDNQSAAAWDAALTVHQQTQITKSSPVMARLLSASSDYQSLSRGVIDFIRDPKVAFKEVDGEMVRRSDEEIMKLWKRKTDGAAKWLETFRDRAINGYVTSAGKEVGPFTRYDEAKIVHERWLEDQFDQGFKHVWGGAALADKGGARAMIAMATGYPKASSRETTAIYDYLIDMLKAGYVGTAGFSNNNLLGATIENIRQGVSLLKSKDVWAADRGARTLDGIKSFAAANLSGPEYDRAMEVVSIAQKAIEEKYGSDVLGAVLEARNRVGITETSFFEEITGASIEGADESLKGMLKSWRASVGEARKLGMLETEAKFGSSPALEKFAGITSAIGQIPTHPARWYERKLAGKIERIAATDMSKLLDDPSVAEELSRLAAAAEPYTARPGVEGLVRVDLYTQRRLAGDSVEMAFNRVMASHFDYSDLSSLDRAMKRVMPFWTWRSRSIAHYYDMLAAKPSVLGHTLRIWDEQHRTQDPRAPYGAKEAGNIFSANLGIQGRVTDPSLDFIKTIDTTAQGIQQDGVLSGLFAPILDAAANDSAAPISLPFILASGRTAEGVPTDTPASIQKPLDWISDVPGGAAFVDLFAHKGKGGKWYWDHPSAAYAFSEALPMVDNVNRMVKPSIEEEDYLQKILGTITQFLGTPIKPISQQQMAKNQAATMIQRKFAAAEQRKKASYDN